MEDGPTMWSTNKTNAQHNFPALFMFYPDIASMHGEPKDKQAGAELGQACVLVILELKFFKNIWGILFLRFLDKFWKMTSAEQVHLNVYLSSFDYTYECNVRMDGNLNLHINVHPIFHLNFHLNVNMNFHPNVYLYDH